MSDPLQTAAAAQRAAKRRRARPAEQTETETPAIPQLVSQGARSLMPPRRRLTPDDAIRRTYLELGRPKRITL